MKHDRHGEPELTLQFFISDHPTPPLNIYASETSTILTQIPRCHVTKLKLKKQTTQSCGVIGNLTLTLFILSTQKQQNF